MSNALGTNRVRSYLLFFIIYFYHYHSTQTLTTLAIDKNGISVRGKQYFNYALTIIRRTIYFGDEEKHSSSHLLRLV